MTAPEQQRYRITDINGRDYAWTGADPSAVGSVFAWGDSDAGTDLVWLHCDGHVFVNSQQIVSLEPLIETQPAAQ